MMQVRLPAGTIEYTDDGDGPPVVLLHGLLMDETVWDTTLPLLPKGFRYIRPVLPLGGHRVAMNPDADLALPGMVDLVADFLDALDLHDVTLVHADWGGGLFLTAIGRDDRVNAMVVLPCEAFDNFPPGLPGRMATLATKLPGGITLAARQLRIGWLRRTPLLFGWMVRRPIPDDVVRRWTDPCLTNAGVRRDLEKYAATTFADAELIRDTEALAEFGGDALVLWSPENRVMPPEHGRRLADLIPNARYAEIHDAYVLSMLDQPAAVAREIGTFLARVPATGR
ncbi:alpha/beta fold hydrolase [Gordonia sp. SL306]|uniref:alpha/beta fold hydrolase n=1 Tax=Gordonia sp. SL306 TaxID=2995145 RepID=UPI00226E37BC|nr:alpha/beta hydrolase [Gordonia sp. SL306]WAC54334.1 alpha/beta hydrolase [Gordonia sp. SL306]